MRRRLYVVLPDVASARQTANDLLLARIEDRHMHFLSRRDMSLGELREASFLQKSDVRHAFFLGAGLGVLGGATLGVILKMTDLGGGYNFDVGTLIICTIAGLLLGAWASTLIGVSTPSVALKPFEEELEAGKILLMVDVPHSRVEEIQALLENRHPEAQRKGIDLTMPAFP
ncbi:DUF1269 domain-containing protein [Ideonella sp.]|uniref:DUF1269 domain-containing protein n=1 Tax=Ideonella sp. TaxID=1929293 RepID=UPI0035B0B1FC